MTVGVHASLSMCSVRVALWLCTSGEARVEHVLAFSEEQQGPNKDLSWTAAGKLCPQNRCPLFTHNGMQISPIAEWTLRTDPHGTHSP